jgi:hypothetical protein
MHGMPGLIAVAGQRGLSAGTLLIAAGGLALYQMTSLVLGPGSSRQLDLSLTVPTVEADEHTESWTSGGRLVLGTLATPAPAAPVWARSAATHRSSSTPAGYTAPAPVRPVASASPQPTPHPSAPPDSPIVREPGPQPVTQKPDDGD